MGIGLVCYNSTSKTIYVHINQIIVLREIKGSKGECLNARYFPIEWCFCAAGPTFGGSGQAGQGGPFVPSLPASTHHAKAI